MSQSNNNNNVHRFDVESIRLYMGTCVARLRSKASIDTIRPLPVFLGLSPGNDFLVVAPEAFSSPLPTTTTGRVEVRSYLDTMKQRVRVNGSYFLSNYLLISVMTAIVVALMHPGMLFVVGIVNGLWWFHDYLIRHQLVVFGVHIQNIMTVQQRFYVLFTITAVTIIWQILVPAFICVLISMFIILCHATLRDNSKLDGIEEYYPVNHSKSSVEEGTTTTTNDSTTEKEFLVGQASQVY